LTAVSGGFRYRFKDGMTYDFDAAGRLTRQADRNGNALDIAHDGAGQLVSVTDADAPGRQLLFSYTAGLLSAVADATGRTWTYVYSGGRLAQVSAPTDAQTLPAVVAYDYYTDPARAGLIRTITNPDGGITTYTYYPDRRA